MLTNITQFDIKIVIYNIQQINKLNCFLILGISYYFFHKLIEFWFGGCKIIISLYSISHLLTAHLNLHLYFTTIFFVYIKMRVLNIPQPQLVFHTGHMCIIIKITIRCYLYYKYTNERVQRQRRGVHRKILYNIMLFRSDYDYLQLFFFSFFLFYTPLFQCGGVRLSLFRFGIYSILLLFVIVSSERFPYMYYIPCMRAYQ